MPSTSDVLFLTLSLVCAYGFALLYWPFLKRLPPAVRSVPLHQASSLSILAFALMIPADRMGLRAGALVLCIELWFKIGDFTRRFAAESSTGNFRRYLRFLLPFPAMLVLFGKREHRLSHESHERGRSFLRIVTGMALFGLAFALVLFANTLPLFQSNFVLDHVFKVTVFVLTMESLSWALYGAERFMGFDTQPVMRFQFLSRSVGEFWCRYNTRVHEWFDHNVFRPTGGRRHPIRSLCLVFFVSGVFHELGFAIATSRFDGYQFVFFMIQAPAILVSDQLNRRVRTFGVFGRIISHSFTSIWMVATSVLFFHGVNRIFPIFYAAQPPLP